MIFFHKVLHYKWFKYERNYFNVQWVMRCLINNSYSFLKKVMKKYFSSLSKIATHPLFPWSKGRYTLLTLVYEYAYKRFHFSPNKIPKHSFSNIAHSCFLFTDHHIKSSGLDFKHNKLPSKTSYIHYCSFKNLHYKFVIMVYMINSCWWYITMNFKYNTFVIHDILSCL